MSSTPTREERLRVMVLWTGETEWHVWGRFSKNAQRSYDEAAALEGREGVADVRVDRTTVITDSLTVAELRAQLLATPDNRTRAALDPQEQP